jgi:hypothetical protein
MVSADPIDAKGRLIKLGDWVRVLQAPVSILGMPEESLHVFSAAIGHTFQVHEITRNGDLELHLYKNKRLALSTWDSVYIEANCCIITRRPTQQSKYFVKHVTYVRELDKKSGRPEWRAQP